MPRSKAMTMHADVLGQLKEQVLARIAKLFDLTGLKEDYLSQVTGSSVPCLIE